VPSFVFARDHLNDKKSQEIMNFSDTHRLFMVLEAKITEVLRAA
jgi:predicted MPP superfamily phosphohydrolase